MLESPVPEPLRHTSSHLTFVGRERDLDVLRERLSMAFAGRGSLVLVSGDAGIGKTTLVSVLAEEAVSRGATVLSGGCYDQTATPPYGPWHEALSRHTWPRSTPDGDETPSDPETSILDFGRVSSQAEIFENVLGTLTTTSARQPVLLILDDLHWADPASLALLRYLARQIESLSLLLIAMYRTGSRPQRHPLSQLLPTLVRESRAERIDLGPLQTDNVQTLLEGHYGISGPASSPLVEYLLQRAEGNPFYTGEVLRTLESEHLLYRGPDGWILGEIDQVMVPPLIRQVVEGHLATLDPETRHLLEIAAVIGQVVPIDLWQTVSTVDDAQLFSTIEQAIDTNLLEARPMDGVVRFHHQLMRDALYDGILPLRARVWHRDVAEVISQSPYPDPDSAAHHFQRAGDARAFQWLLRAGLRAWNSAAWLTAAARFEAASDMLAGMEDRQLDRGWLLFATGYLLRFSQNVRTIEYLDEAERLAVAAGSPVLAAYITYHRGTSRCLRGDTRQGLPETERGVNALEALSSLNPMPGTDDHVRTVIAGMLAGTDAAIPSSHVPEPSHEPGTTTMVSQRGALVNWLAMAGNYSAALKMGEQYRSEMIAAYGDDHLKIRTCISGRMGLAQAYAAMGRLDEARAEFEIAARSFSSVRDYLTAQVTYWYELFTTIYVYRADHIAERLRMVKAATDAWMRGTGQMWAPSSDSPGQMLLAFIEGRWKSIVDLAGTHEPTGSIIRAQAQAFELVFGMTARHRGDTLLAWEHIKATIPDGPQSDQIDSVWFALTPAFQSLAVELALDARDLKSARDWLEFLDRWIDWSGAPMWMPRSLLLWARYRHLAGDSAAAFQVADECLSLASEPRQTLVLLAVHRFMGQLEREAGHFEDAEQHLSESLSLADACAAPFERAMSLVALAELYAAAGRTSDGQAALQEARSICEPLGAQPTLERINELDVLLSNSRQSESGHAVLSPREREVLSLVAEGKTDREIAAVLFISHHTVMSHVSNILNKLGVDSRSAAVAQAIRRNLV